MEKDSLTAFRQLHEGILPFLLPECSIATIEIEGKDIVKLSVES